MYLASGLGQSENFPPSTLLFGSELFGETIGVGTVVFVVTFAATHTNFLFFLSHIKVFPATFAVAPGFVQGPPNFAAANAPVVSPSSNVTQIEVITSSVFFDFKKLDIKERLTPPDRFARAPPLPPLCDHEHP